MMEGMTRRSALGALSAASLVLAGCATSRPTALEGSGDLGLVIERGTGSVLIINTSHRTVLARVEGLGDL